MRKLQLTIISLLFLSNLNACVTVSTEEAHASLWPILKRDIVNSFNNESVGMSLVQQLVADFGRTYKKGSEQPVLSMKLALESIYGELKILACKSPQRSNWSAQPTGCGTLNKGEICCCPLLYE